MCPNINSNHIQIFSARGVRGVTRKVCVHDLLSACQGEIKVTLFSLTEANTLSVRGGKGKILLPDILTSNQA